MILYWHPIQTRLGTLAHYLFTLYADILNMAFPSHSLIQPHSKKIEQLDSLKVISIDLQMFRWNLPFMSKYHILIFINRYFKAPIISPCNHILQSFLNLRKNIQKESSLADVTFIFNPNWSLFIGAT